MKNLALGDLSLEGLEETRNLVGKQNPGVAIHVSHLDVSDEASVEAFYADVVAHFGRIDFAANVAGYGGKALPSTETSEEQYDRLFAVNQRGVSMLHSVPRRHRHGTIHSLGHRYSCASARNFVRCLSRSLLTASKAVAAS